MSVVKVVFFGVYKENGISILLNIQPPCGNSDFAFLNINIFDCPIHFVMQNIDLYTNIFYQDVI